MSRPLMTACAVALWLASPLAFAHNHEATPPKEEPAEQHADHHGEHHGNHHEAHNDEHKEGMPLDFATLDANADGRIEKTELPEGHPMAGHFDMMDKDKDGKVSKAEFDAMHAGHDSHH